MTNRRSAQYTNATPIAEVAPADGSGLPGWAGFAFARFVAVGQLGAARQVVIDAGGEGRLGGDEQAQLAGFCDGPHAAHQLGVVAIRAGEHRIGRGVDAGLPEWGKDVARRHAVDAHVVGRLVDGQRLGERRDGALGGHIGRGVGLRNGAHQARHVDDVALHGAHVGQCVFAGCKDADQIELEQIAEVLHRKLVDGARGWVPAGVVNQAVDAAVLGHHGVDHALDVVGFGHVALDELHAAGALGIELCLERFAFADIPRTEDNCCAGIGKNAYTALADPFAATGDDGDFVVVAHRCNPLGTTS